MQHYEEVKAAIDTGSRISSIGAGSAKNRGRQRTKAARPDKSQGDLMGRKYGMPDLPGYRRAKPEGMTLPKQILESYDQAAMTRKSALS